MNCKLLSLTLIVIVSAWSLGCQETHKASEPTTSPATTQSQPATATVPAKFIPPILIPATGAATMPSTQASQPDTRSFHEKFLSLRTGTEMQVTTILGDPDERHEMGEGTHTLVHDTWNRDGKEYYIQFFRGNLRVKEIKVKAPTKSANLKAQYEQVQQGMDYTKVVEIMGEPANASGSGDGLNTVSSAQWQDEESVYMVLFLNNKVTTKQIQGD